MLNKSTDDLTLFTHYLLWLLLVALLSLSLSYALDQSRNKEPQIYLQKTGSLVLKQAEKFP